jgi:putative transposase
MIGAMNTSIRPNQRSLRKGRVSIAGQRYLITIVCHRRERRFMSWEAAAAVASKLDDRSLWLDSILLCWVLMPDHLHLLVELGHAEDLPSLMRRIKCVSARVANRADGRSQAMWMRGFHDRALRSEEVGVAVARYIIANPVRAGLVEDVGRYPFWDAVWLQTSAHPFQ